MCIIIDTNTLVNVFDSTSSEHNEFIPVFEWIYKGKGKVVYGGTEYFKELKKLPKMLTLFTELNKLRKGIYVSNLEVDKKAQIAADMIQHRDFDDQHLIGLLQESKCMLICSLDKRAYPYFTHNSFFSSKKPKIYRSKSNSDLLVEKNIAEICKPCLKTTKKQKEIITKLIN